MVQKLRIIYANYYDSDCQQQAYIASHQVATANGSGDFMLEYKLRHVAMHVSTKSLPLIIWMMPLPGSAESAIMAGIFGRDSNRRGFLKGRWGFNRAGSNQSVCPLEDVKAAIVDAEKARRLSLNVGFVPLTCATPISHGTSNGLL